MNLTSDQLKAIDRHLRKENWLLNEDLIAELADHYVAGLEDRLAKGMTFDAALREMHTGFGGRKGLLKMEEEYQINQLKVTFQLLMHLVISYLHLPKLLFTLLLEVTVYSAVRLRPDFDMTWLFNTVWILIVTVVVQIVVAGFILFQLVKYSKRGAFSKKLGLIVMVPWLFHWVSRFISFDEWMYTYPLPASLLITFFLLCEIAAIKLISYHIRKYGIPTID